jgi:hypothetical protein
MAAVERNDKENTCILIMRLFENFEEQFRVMNTQQHLYTSES